MANKTKKTKNKRQSHEKLQFIRHHLSIGLSRSVRLQGGPVDLQSLIMWYAVWGSPHWHRLSSPNPHFTIESPNFPILIRNLFSWTQAFREWPCPRGCLTSLGCVVAVYVVLVLAEGSLVDHSLVVIPEMSKDVCEI